jgi:hypothetical protein
MVNKRQFQGARKITCEEVWNEKGLKIRFNFLRSFGSL